MWEAHVTHGSVRTSLTKLLGNNAELFPVATFVTLIFFVPVLVGHSALTMRDALPQPVNLKTDDSQLTVGWPAQPGAHVTRPRPATVFAFALGMA